MKRATRTLTGFGALILAAAAAAAIPPSLGTRPAPLAGTKSLSTQPAGKQPPTVPYVLTDKSDYLQGCFPAPPYPCAGPLFLASDFSGGFGLKFTGTDPEGFQVFEVSSVLLLVGFGDQLDVIMGDGTYRRSSGPDAEQEMVLDLSINGWPVTVFDSGVVPVPEDGAAIDVSVDMNDQQNYDILMHIAADPGQG